MPQWLKDWGTFAIAAWGALTGTFAVIHNWRMGRRDRGRLRVVPELRPDESVPPTLSLKAEVTNTGRRTLQFSRYVLERPLLAVARLNLPPWRAVHDETMDDSVVLKEGDQRLVPLSPSQEALKAARRLRIVDTTGKKWKGKSALRGARIVAERTIDPIDAVDFGAKGEPGSVHLGLYPPAPGDSDYRVQVRFFGPGVSAWYGNYDPKGRIELRRFADLNAARSAFDEAARSIREFHEKGHAVARPRSFPKAPGYTRQL